MKKLKKLLSIVLAVAMVMSLAVSVTADDTYSIVISNPEKGETYSAYKIFDVTTDGTNYSYTINSKTNPFYEAINTAVGNSGSLENYLKLTVSASDSSVYVVEFIGAGDGSDNDAFTAALAAVIKGVIDNSQVTTTPAASGNADNNTSFTLDVTDSGAGYYYVDTTVGSVVALTTTDPTATINEKWNSPSVEKGVYNDAPADDPTVTGTTGSYDTTGGETGGTTGDSDAAIGDTVYYQTTISGIYGVSNLVLHDTMDEGLDFNDSSIVATVYVKFTATSGLSADDNTYTYDSSTNTFTQVTNGTSLTEGSNYYTKTTLTSGTGGDYTVTSPGYYYAGLGSNLQYSNDTFYTYNSSTKEYSLVSTSLDNDTEYYVKDTFDISFNITNVTVTDGSYLVVEYTATVNSSAVIYAGTATQSNNNETYVSYGSASTTEVDKTQTYVYPMYIYKYYNDSGTATALSGAVFTIKNADGKYAVFTYDDSSGVYTLGAEISGVMTYWVDSLDTNSGTTYYTLTTTDSGILKIAGLDADTTYTIHEESAPSGYNALFEDLSCYIVGSDDASKTQGDVYYWGVSTSSKDDAKSNSTAIGTITKASTAVPIENKSGTEMPETGGIGVTIFYVVGGILVLAAAGVIVISKKRRTEK
ncbi:MAG: LPXTG cell wall anchor domain-containing protein [Oscillospiraceae bacterium]|nr:LPXTG cell wall anchor domain-containing protein [Oscillospiraceae bacterium]